MSQRLLLPCLVILLHAAWHASVVDASEIICSNGCSIIHPQQHFCNADTAYKARVIEDDMVNAHHEVVTYNDASFVRYEIEVIAPLKGSSWISAGTKVYFYSPTGFTCSVPTLTKQEIYLIAGKISSDGLLVITQCDGIATKWSDLTPTLIAGVEGEYLRHCDTCTIKSAGTAKWIPSEASLAEQESGFWSKELNCFFNPIPSTRYGGDDCETNYTICVPGADGSSPCHWEANTEYDNCFELRESTWFLMEKAEPAFRCRSECDYQQTKKLRYKCYKATKKMMLAGHPPC